MKKHVHLKINMMFMYIFGVFKFKFNNVFYTHLNWSYSNFVKIYLITFVCTQYTQFFQILDEDLFKIVSNLSVSLLYTVAILKMLACDGKKIQLLVNEIYDTERKILSHGNEEVKEIFFRYVRWNYFIDKLLIWVGVCTLLPYYIGPVLEEMTMETEIFNQTINNVTRQFLKRPLPFSSWFPFNRYRYYYFCYGYQMLAGFIGGSMTVATDIFFVGLMIFAKGQIKILQHCLRSSKILAVRFAKVDKNISLEQAIQHVVKHCIIMHQIIIKYVEDLNTSLKTLMLCDFGITSIQMATVGLQIITVGVGFNMMFAVEFLGAMFIQLFLFYWHANEILLESLEISTAIWESAWFEYNQSMKKSLALVMMRSQRPLVLSVGPFYNMSTDTMISILRGAYTYVAVVRQMYNRET